MHEKLNQNIFQQPPNTNVNNDDNNRIKEAERLFKLIAKSESGVDKYICGPFGNRKGLKLLKNYFKIKKYSINLIISCILRLHSKR